MSTKHSFTTGELIIAAILIGALCGCIGFAAGYIAGYAVEYQAWLAHCSLVIGTHVCGAP
jgi:hypothetical protein